MPPIKCPRLSLTLDQQMKQHAEYVLDQEAKVKHSDDRVHFESDLTWEAFWGNTACSVDRARERGLAFQVEVYGIETNEGVVVAIQEQHVKDRTSRKVHFDISTENPKSAAARREKKYYRIVKSMETVANTLGRLLNPKTKKIVCG